MNILGISGLEKAIRFKKSQWPGLEDREYRISQGHDSAAALVVDGRIVAAAAEERFSRKKHTGDFPVCAISRCLSEAGLSLGDVDEIAHGFDYAPYRELYSLDPITAKLYDEVFAKDVLLAQVKRCLPAFPAERVHQVGHHLSHAASAFFTSGWDECLVIILDAMGEVQSTSVYQGRQGSLRSLCEISANDSIGILYSLVTLHLGFDFNADEYKIMGLAPYGNPERFRPFFEREVQLRKNGTMRIPMLGLNRTRDERENYLLTRKYLDENLIGRRHPEDEITEVHRDVAAALQEALERCVMHVCTSFAQTTGLRRLALAGGVTLNCTANGKLLRSGQFDEIYVQPAAGDDGSALGAALYRASLAGECRNERLPVPFFGPSQPMTAVETALVEFEDRIAVKRFDTLEETCAEAAGLIADGRVVAWHRGRMEFGPRALGNRSILADPGHPEMRDRINAMVKKREAFRPFAPAVSIEQAHVWFDLPAGANLPYMIMTVDVRERYRPALPAITHVNGSARVQTVSADDNEAFHKLLQAVGRSTGKEMVLNTSFNVKGQPIVNTPREAIETFLGTGIDCLFVEDILITRGQADKGSRQ
ncbi:MAG: carbamoyltransferase [Acidobacteriia bacterium]|nr:carbamoyltransferase [Terriglobia bacterium]